VPPTPLIRLSSTDRVTMVGGQRLDQVWPEAEDPIERTLASAVDRFGRELG